MASSNVYLVDQRVLRQLVGLLVAHQIQLRRGENVRNRAEPMEHHCGELDDQDQGEEEHEHQTDRFQLQVFLADVNLFFFFVVGFSHLVNMKIAGE